MEFPTKQLQEWFLSNRRSLPWRDNPTPYRVWISEIMLQQTQVSVVIPYFERWMQRFPTIHSLAEASIEEIIKLWEGLGYYSRARNIHEAAQFLVANFQGSLPEDAESLQKIKGLGPYTVGAIRSFAFHQKCAAVDGNVIRVLSRFFEIQDPVDQPKTLKRIWEKAEALLPENEPWLITEGLIELGAMICKKEPFCTSCPLKSRCLAHRNGLQKSIPWKKKKQTITLLKRFVGVIEAEGYFYLRKGEKGKVMSDLYEFPFLETESENVSITEITSRFEKEFQLNLSFQKALSFQEHGFTRFRVELYPFYFTTKKKSIIGEWVEREKLESLPFSSGHRRLLKSVLAKDAELPLLYL